MIWATGVRLTPHDNMRGCCDDIQCGARVRAMVNTAFRSSEHKVPLPLRCFTLGEAECATQEMCKKGRDDKSCRPAAMGKISGNWADVMNEIIGQALTLNRNSDTPIAFLDIAFPEESETFNQARSRVLPLVRRILETHGQQWHYKGERYEISKRLLFHLSEKIPGSSENIPGSSENIPGLTLQHARHEGPPYLVDSSIEVAQAMQHLNEIYEKLEREKNDYGQLREVRLDESDELVIFGDLHGQHSDLHRWWDKVGHPADTPAAKKYLFLGDYVDRGKKDVELAFELLALQHKYPTRVFLLRGNHEDRNTSNMYGFKEHCLQYDGSWREKHLTVKWDDDGFVDSESLEAVKRARSALHSRFMDIFDLLPVAALVRHGDAKRYFCVHGGLSKRLENIDTLNKIQRPPRGEHSDLIYELCWSDPSRHPDCKVPSRTPHPLTTCDDAFETRPGRMDWMSGFRDKPNPDRPIFDKNAVKHFTEHNKITHIFRGHQVPDDGYDFPFGSEDGSGGNLTTVFSAPWYSQGNVGAVVVLRGASAPADFVQLHGIPGLSGI